MALLFDGWFPDGNAAAKLAAHDYMNVQGVQSVTPVVETGQNVRLVENPLVGGEKVVLLGFKHSDTHFVDDSVRTMLLPITPTAGDPIVDWGGADALTRRWYRFAFMHGPWREEPRVLQSSNLLVVWQLHDQADTGDTYVEPPLWIRDDGRGYWEVWNYSDPNAVTSISTRTARLLSRVKRVPWTWYEFVVYMKPSWTSGDLSIWLNGARIFQETGKPNCFNHLPARGGSFNYCEYGAYGGKPQQVLDREVYHKGMQIGDQAYASFNAFMAACGSAIVEKQLSFQVGGVTGRVD